jgi:hypothetical protein
VLSKSATIHAHNRIGRGTSGRHFTILQMSWLPKDAGHRRIRSHTQRDQEQCAVWWRANGVTLMRNAERRAFQEQPWLFFPYAEAMCSAGLRTVLPGARVGSATGSFDSLHIENDAVLLSM